MRRAALLALGVALAIAALAQADLIEGGNIRIHFEGRLSPRTLPRQGEVPVRISVAARIAATNGRTPPQLRQITIAINRHGRFDSVGLPRCSVDQIQPTTTADALRACRSSLVGQGHFSAEVLLPQSSPFPSNGRVYAFNGTYRGHPAILAHVYGTKPLATSNTIPFLISKAHGTYGTILRAALPQATSEWGYVTGLDLDIGRIFSSHGKRHSYVSARCPAPRGISVVPFPLVHASFSFAHHRTLSKTLNRSCRAR